MPTPPFSNSNERGGTNSGMPELTRATREGGSLSAKQQITGRRDVGARKIGSSKTVVGKLGRKTGRNSWGENGRLDGKTGSSSQPIARKKQRKEKLGVGGTEKEQGGN